MKKIVFLFVSTVVLGLTSCDKDDDGDSASIEGKWEYYKEGYIVNNTEVLIDYQNECSNQKDYIEILSGSVIKTHIFEIPFQSTSCEEAISTGTWSRNGNSITVSFGGVTSTDEILELSDQFLKIKYYNEEDEEYNIYIFKRV